MKRKVIRAPKWLRDRMKKLRELPRPTLKQVEAQFEAAKNQGSNYRKDLPDRYS